MLAQDMPKFYRGVTREADTKLVLYYSGLMDGIAGQRHPDWIMCNPDGASQEGAFGDFKCFIAHPICPLSAYWDEWASVQIREIIRDYDPDGIWVDGDWPGPCYCPRCRERFRKDTGWREPWGEAQKRASFSAEYAKTWNRITHEWRTRFCAFIKELKPSCLYSAGNVSPRREFLTPFDWRSGDFFSPGYFYLHDMARMMRWYATLGVPYDAYICDTSFTHVRKDVRSRSKTLPRMLQEAATVAANGGAVGYWTYPLGNGALVPSRMRKAITVRKFLEERRDVLLHTTSAQWTAILVSDPSAPTFGGAAVEGAHKAMAALHRSPDVMDETGVAENMPHDLIVLPEQPALDEATARRLEQFVLRGGKLLTSGVSIRSAFLQKILGVKSVHPGTLQDGHVLLKTCDEPTGVDSAWDRLELRGAEELYPLYLSWDQFNPECRNLVNNWPMHGQLDEERPEPAGFPAAIARRVGKGRVVHVCTGIFAQYLTLGDPQILRWLREIVDFLQPEPLFCTDALSFVDVSLRRKGDALLVHFVNGNPGRDLSKLNASDLWVDDIPAIGPIASRIRCARKPRKALWEPGGLDARTEWNDGILRFVLPRLEIHACLNLHGWTRPKGF